MISYFKEKVHLFLYQDMCRKEARKFSLLSAAFFFIIGGYWTVRSLKNAILKETVGIYAIPDAKKLSVVVMICLVLFYSKIVDHVAKHRLFSVFCTFYTVSFLGIAFFFVFPDIIDRRVLGFASYTIIESFGSLLVALFWSFVALNVDVASAKRGYAIVFASGQIGALVGTTLVRNAPFFGIPLLVCVSAGAIACIPYFIHKFVVTVRKEDDASGECEVVDRGVSEVTPTDKKSSGLFEGIWLLCTRPYLLGIFLIIGLYEVVVTIFDFQVQLLASRVYETAASYASFNALYGQLITLIACLFAFLGTRFFIKKFGFKVCLLIFPTIVGLLVCVFYFLPGLWVGFACMVTIKALSYGFNNPVKEMIYIPTSDAIKFKGKAWIEMFGTRFSKGGGATLNSFFSSVPHGFMTYGVLLSLSFVGVWFLIALVMGIKFTRLVKNQEVVS